MNRRHASAIVVALAVVLCFVAIGADSRISNATKAEDPPKADAKALAAEVLNEGSILFDKRDAAAMAATYLEDAEAQLVLRFNNQRKLSTQVVRGRAEIEKEYSKFFEKRSNVAISRNDVEYAELLAPDVLLIVGKFNVDTSQAKAFSFVQVRTKVGDAWLIQSMKVFAIDK